MGGEGQVEPQALEGEDSLGTRTSCLVLALLPAPQLPESRPRTNLKHSLIHGSSPYFLPFSQGSLSISFQLPKP